jgi:hypothetical protein
MAGARGTCPSRDELTRYHRRDLPEARAAELEIHAVRCPECDLVLDQMERFDQVSGDEAGARGAVAAFLSGRSRPASGYLWRPALWGAIAATVVLAFPMYWLSRRAVPDVPVKPIQTENGGAKLESRENLATLARVIVVPQIRRGAELPLVRLGSGETSVVLSFFVPMGAGQHYEASIVDRAHRPLFDPIDISSEFQTGNVSLSVASALLPAGSYMIVVTGPSDGSASNAPMRFEVVR